jgi:hypothetical protein
VELVAQRGRRPPAILPRSEWLARAAHRRLIASTGGCSSCRPIHQWKALGEAVTTVILHGGVLYYNLSYGGYTPKSQLAAINPLFLSETMILYK